jgi:tRNA1(Val) A37 N6-methylase TrmN6
MHSRQSEVSSYPFAVTDDAVLGGRLKLLQPARGHRAGHDAILLAAAAPRSGHAIDLGAGIGTAGLALLVRGAARSVTLVDIDRDLVRLATGNAERNGFGERAEAVHSGIDRLAQRNGPTRPGAASAELVIMNPPFNDPATRRESPDAGRRRAHSSGEDDLESWIAAAERLLKGNGRLVMIHRPEAIAGILSRMEPRFGALEVIPIHARAGGPAIRVLVRAQKAKRSPLTIRAGFVLAEDDGRPTHEAEAVLRGAAPLDA